METTATILHADLDAFYASVEQLLDPSLRGKPIAVGGGVVLAASYEAKAFGVSGGMSGRRARELCPQLTFVEGHFKDYQRLGDAVSADAGKTPFAIGGAEFGNEGATIGVVTAYVESRNSRSHRVGQLRIVRQRFRSPILRLQRARWRVRRPRRCPRLRL